MTAVAKDNIPLAIGAILATSLALALGDAIIKQISTGFPLWQIFMLRSLIALPVLAGFAAARGEVRRLVPETLFWTGLRSLMLVTMWVAFYASLPHIPLSVAAAVFYTLPLFITLFAAALLGERIGALGWVAVATGFAGVLLILKPSGADFDAYALLPLASAVLYALAMIVTRSKCRDEHPLALSFSLNTTFVFIGLLATVLTAISPPEASAVAADPFLLGPWTAMAPREWMVMSILATATLIGSIGTAIAYQAGPASMVSTYDFAYLAFAALWGLVFFGEIPDALSALGIALIAAGGILSVRRA